MQRAQELGYAEADPTDDVTGRDAAAKMAILARLAFSTPVHLDQVIYEGIEHLTAEDVAYARDLNLGLKLIGTAERVDGGISVRVHPAFLYPGHPLASVNGSFNAVTVESDAITEITLSGPGRGRPADRQRRARRRDQRDDPARLDARDERLAADRQGRQVGLLPGDARSTTSPACWPRSPRCWACRARRSSPCCRTGLGGRARLVMVLHPLLESRFYGAVRLLSRMTFVRSEPRAIRVIEEEFVDCHGPDHALPRAAPVRPR